MFSKLKIVAAAAALCACAVTASGQDSLTAKKPAHYFYHDTVVQHRGFKVEIRRNVSAYNVMKTVLTITNPTDSYIIIDPNDVYCMVGGTNEKYHADGKKEIVIRPACTVKFAMRFKGRDFRDSSVVIDFSKFRLADTLRTIYDFSDMNITKENARVLGPVRWTLMKKDYHASTGIRLIAQLEYSGTNFLALLPENANLKTVDGGSYIHMGKRSVKPASTNNYYYDKRRPFEKQILVFPANRDVVRPEGGNALLSFKNVIKEYSVSVAAGFKLNLVKGTIEDFRGHSKENADDKDDDDKDDDK